MSQFPRRGRQLLRALIDDKSEREGVFMTFDEFDRHVRRLALSRWAIVLVLAVGWGPLLVTSLLYPVLAQFWDHDELAGAALASLFVLGPVSAVIAITIAVKRWMS